MKFNYKKQKLVESLGYDVNFKKTYGSKAQNVRVTPNQFQRLMEAYMIYEETLEMKGLDAELSEYDSSFQTELSDDILDEMNFGDDGGLNLQADVNTDTENFNNPIDLDEINYEDVDHSDRDEFDGRKSRVVGVDSDIDKQRHGMSEDSEGEESYNYDEDLHHDRIELRNLDNERDRSSDSSRDGIDQHIAALVNSMKYDEKRGVGKDDKYRREPGEHFFHYGNGLAESKTQKTKLLKQAKRELSRRLKK